MDKQSTHAETASARHRRWVRRERILSSLNQKSDSRIVLFAAPAGFGKTTTMAQWAVDVERRGAQTAWLSLEANDNDDSTFLARIVDALSSALGHSVELDLTFRSSPIPQMDMVLKAVLASFRSSDRETVFFIDDYHVLHAEPVRHFIEQLTKSAPANLKFVIGSRALPDLGLGRLRVLGDVFEVGADHLRFAAQEADIFFNEKLGLDVSRQAVETLCLRAEGWVAGLQLASLSIGADRAPEAVIATFTGAHRNIADFLMAEVFLQLPERIARFLLLSSVLERFSSEVCKVIFRLADAEALISEIETRNLFLVPLDDERRWYRYHHLFRDFLARELERREPELITPLHLAAADWFGERKMLTEAIGHALAAGDHGRAATLVESHALALIAQCRLLYVRQLLALLPQPMIDQRIRLQLVILWLAVHSSQPEIATGMLASARKLALSGPTDGGDPGTLPGTSIAVELDVLESAVFSTLEQFEAARDKALSALRIIAPDAWFMEGASANIVGYNHHALGNLDAARAALHAARRAHERSGSLLGLTIADCYMALVERSAGQLRLAEQILRAAIAEARVRTGANSYAEALAGSLLAEIAYETNQTDEALSLVESLGPQIEGAAIIVYSLASVPTYARLLQFQGRTALALEILDRVYQRVRGSVYRRLSSVLVHEQVKLLLVRGRPADARILFDRHHSDLAGIHVAPAHEFEHLAESRLLIAEGANARAAEGLARLLERTGRDRRVRRQILVLILLAKNAAAGHRVLETDAFLLDALRLALPHGFVRSFADEGKSIVDGLTRLRHHLAASDPEISRYASRLVLAARDPAEPEPGEKKTGAHRESLTEREHQLLALVSRGLSNRDIAACLSLSETTVKWHLKNIFGKLAVNNRMQAVRALESLAAAVPPSK